MSFKSLGLIEDLLRALAAADHKNPTPIQAQAVPVVLEGHDVLGIAQTGTGKTAAFTLPLLQHLVADKAKVHPKRPRALILAPTRELALQIDQSVRTYSKFLNIRHSVVIGGVSQHGQAKALSRGVDILTACPGRLMDLMNQRLVALDDVEYLVLDEADRMLDMGFVRDVRKIVAATRSDRLTQFFSATMTKEVETLAAEMLHEPRRIEVTPASVPVERIEQSVVFVEGSKKRGLLNEMLNDNAMSRVIVFTRTKHGANKLAQQLDRDGIPADALHGNKSQSQRERALARFRRGQARVLVATDIAARGIDVDGVSHVINYDLPMEPEAYVHRIGRTARAGNDGRAISFCGPDEFGKLTDIEKLLKRALVDPANDPRPARGQGGGAKPGKSGRGNRRRRGGKGGDANAAGGGNGNSGNMQKQARPQNAKPGQKPVRKADRPNAGHQQNAPKAENAGDRPRRRPRHAA
ncbi:DEAD/DEAH box helicase [Marivibrio halodurans]|uniref:DEAD/DEAH box helicase n=1 Tax=Marivibrio halodurans TaxID=2039722 RepID=A0A8J7SL44_9PROT|nr:DEAD/DEAH box helicase [Marivibrio halodurans]